MYIFWRASRMLESSVLEAMPTEKRWSLWIGRNSRQCAPVPEARCPSISVPEARVHVLEGGFAETDLRLCEGGCWGISPKPDL